MVLRWSPELTVRHRIDSSVPARHRSTGRPPTEDHPAGEGHRDEYMRTFFAAVAGVLPVDDDLLLIGDGEVVEHFADQVRADGRSLGRQRRIEVATSRTRKPPPPVQPTEPLIRRSRRRPRPW
jgi:hypothetical protein